VSSECLSALVSLYFLFTDEGSTLEETPNGICCVHNSTVRAHTTSLKPEAEVAGEEEALAGAGVAGGVAGPSA
jgi:hypothetical protein